MNPPSIRYILFIDDIHTVTGPNAQQGGGVMDASILLKPLLSRGELRCIGATTLDKYRKFIEKDPALERRFQQVCNDSSWICSSLSFIHNSILLIL
jgi:ATP-dependent Clp protease ATP-binding subunit ClpB